MTPDAATGRTPLTPLTEAEWTLNCPQFPLSASGQLARLMRYREGIEALRAEVATLRESLFAWTVESVTAGANPQKDGGMSAPLFHVSCKLCGARWSKQTWKRDEAEKMHPPGDCLNAPPEAPHVG